MSPKKKKKKVLSSFDSLTCVFACPLLFLGRFLWICAFFFFFFGHLNLPITQIVHWKGELIKLIKQQQQKDKLRIVFCFFFGFVWWGGGGVTIIEY